MIFSEKKIILDEILEEANNLPSMPTVLDKILKHIDNPLSIAKDFEGLIATDPTLTLRLLKLANSAYFGYPGSIVNIAEAIKIIGFKAVRMMVLAISAYQLIGFEIEQYGLKKGELWIHSYSCALMAQEISSVLDIKQENEEFFVCSLLHDIGKILINKYLVKNNKSLDFEFNENDEVSEDNIITQEQEKIGYSHAFLTYKITKNWGLPDLVYNSIKYYPEPSTAPEKYKQTSEIIKLANSLTNNMFNGFDFGTKVKITDTKTLNKFNLDKKTINKINEDIKDLINNLDFF